MATVALHTNSGSSTFPIHYPGGSMSSVVQPTMTTPPIMGPPPGGNPAFGPPVPMPNPLVSSSSFVSTPPLSSNPSSFPPLKPKNDVELDRPRLITVLTYLSQLLAPAFEKPIRLIVHGGACMLLHPMLYELSLQQRQRHQQQQLKQQGQPQGQDQLPQLPSRSSTRDVDYLHRAFVQEMTQLGVRHAPEKLAACIAETARRFGLGADWMNSDADIALPMATSPSGATYDPIYLAAIQPNNLDLHTVFRSPNGALTLVSVTPFWSVALKLVRYTPPDAADICLLLRNGTLLSGTAWSVESLRQWLFSNCWPMGFANYDSKRLQMLNVRLNHAVRVVAEWGPAPTPGIFNHNNSKSNSSPHLIGASNPNPGSSITSPGSTPPNRYTNTNPSSLAHFFPDSLTASASWTSVNVPFTPNVKFDPLVAMGGDQKNGDEHAGREAEVWNPRFNKGDYRNGMGTGSHPGSLHSSPDHRTGATNATSEGESNRDRGQDRASGRPFVPPLDHEQYDYGHDFSVLSERDKEGERESKKARRKRRRFTLGLGFGSRDENRSRDETRLEDKTNMGARNDEKAIATEPETESLHWHPNPEMMKKHVTSKSRTMSRDLQKENSKELSRPNDRPTSMDMPDLRESLSEILRRERENIEAYRYRGIQGYQYGAQYAQGFRPGPYPPGAYQQGPPHLQAYQFGPHPTQAQAQPYQYGAADHPAAPVVPDVGAYKEKKKKSKEKEMEKRRKEKEKEKERRRERVDKMTFKQGPAAGGWAYNRYQGAATNGWGLPLEDRRGSAWEARGGESESESESETESESGGDTDVEEKEYQDSLKRLAASSSSVIRPPAGPQGSWTQYQTWSMQAHAQAQAQAQAQGRSQEGQTADMYRSPPPPYSAARTPTDFDVSPTPRPVGLPPVVRGKDKSRSGSGNSGITGDDAPHQEPERQERPFVPPLPAAYDPYQYSGAPLRSFPL